MIGKQLNVYKKEELQVGDFRFDYGRYQLFKKDLPISLSSKEVQLIQFFWRIPSKYFLKNKFTAVFGVLGMSMRIRLWFLLIVYEVN